MGPPSHRVATAASLVALSVTGAALAQDAPAARSAPVPPRQAPRLEYTRGPAKCPSEESFRGEVAAKLDGISDHFDASGAAVVRVWFEKVGDDYRGTLEFTNAAGKKELPVSATDESCKVVARALGSSAATYIPAELWQRPAIPMAPPPAPPSQAAPACDPCAASATDQLTRMRRELDEQGARIDEQGEQIADLRKRLDGERKKTKDMDLTGALSAGALITANLTSNVGPGVWIGGEARSGPLSLGLEARVVLPAPVRVDSAPAYAGTVDFDLSQVVGLLTPCGRYLYFFGCAVAGAGVQIAYDSDPRGPFTNFFPLVQLGGRVGIEVPLGQTAFAVRGWGEVLYSTPPTRVGYRPDEDHVYRVERPSVSAFFGLGFVVKLGGKGAR
jgi:hypothetical protein